MRTAASTKVALHRDGDLVCALLTEYIYVRPDKNWTPTTVILDSRGPARSSELSRPNGTEQHAGALYIVRRAGTRRTRLERYRSFCRCSSVYRCFGRLRAIAHKLGFWRFYAQRPLPQLFHDSCRPLIVPTTGSSVTIIVRL